MEVGSLFHKNIDLSVVYVNMVKAINVYGFSLDYGRVGSDGSCYICETFAM